MLKLEVNVHDLTDIFSRFKEVIGESFWIKRVNTVTSEIRGYPFLKDYLLQENSFAFALANWSFLIDKYGIIPRSHRLNRDFYPAIALMAQILNFIDSASDKQKKAFIRRVQSSFRNPDDLRAMILEFMVAAQFEKRGNIVTWPDVTEVGSPDLIIEDLGLVGLQVECKSVSVDKGKKIHHREALEFINLMRPGLKQLLGDYVGKMGIALVITIPNRLPRSPKSRERMTEDIINAAQAFSSQSLESGVELEVSEFDLSLLSHLDINSNNEMTRNLVDQLTRTVNSDAAFIKSADKLLLVAIKSKSEDSVLGYTFETLRQSSKRQVSRELPAIYMVEFNGVNSDELFKIATHDFNADNPPTGLRIAVSEFLSSLDRPHVVGVVFLSKGEIRKTADGVYNEGGAAYYFPVKDSKFWHDDFENLIPMIST